LVDLATRHRVINRPLTQGMDAWQALNTGKYVTTVSADWYLGYFRSRVPSAEGLWRAQPLPVWKQDRQQPNTSCAGGTGNCLLKASQFQAQAWEWMKFTMTSLEGNLRRYEINRYYPQLKEALKDKRLHVPDSYFSGQDLAQLFHDVAPNMPPQHPHPMRPEVNGIINPAVNAAMRGERSPADGLRAAAAEARARLKQEGF
jgi:ABC-type glycerol-3-phosphate transport system substrate-binding protein